MNLRDAFLGASLVALGFGVASLGHRAPPPVATVAAPSPPATPLPHEEPCQAWCRVHDGGADCLARMEFKDARRPAGTPSVCR